MMADGIATDVAVGQVVTVGKVEIVVEKKSGQKVRLRILAPEEMKVSTACKKPAKAD